jgi:hypothetical protein
MRAFRHLILVSDLLTEKPANRDISGQDALSISVALMKFLLSLLLLAFEAQGAQFWDGAISYDPPFRMYTNAQPSRVGSPEGNWTFYTTGMSAGTNGVAEVSFSLGSVEDLGLPQPAQPLTTIAGLKNSFDSLISSSGKYYSTATIELGGMEALMCTAITNNIPHGLLKWYCTVSFFWEQNPVWQKSRICTITMTAQKRETLGLLTNSLKTVKVIKGKANNPQGERSNPLLGKWYIDASSGEFAPAGGGQSGARGIEFKEAGQFVTFGYNFTIRGLYSPIDSNRVRLENKELSETFKGKQVTEKIDLPAEFLTKFYKYDTARQELIEEKAMITPFRFTRTPPR